MTGLYRETLIYKLVNPSLQPTQTQKYSFLNIFYIEKWDHTNNGTGFVTKEWSGCITRSTIDLQPTQEPVP